MIKGMVRLFVKGVTKSAVTTTVTLGVFFIGREIGRSEGGKKVGRKMF